MASLKGMKTECEYCGKTVYKNGLKLHLLACKAALRVACFKEDDPPRDDDPTNTAAPSLDPVAVIRSLNPERIRQQIRETEGQLNALRALLTVAEARDAEPSSNGDR